MKMNSFYVYLSLYFLSIYLMMNSNSILIIWILLELNMMSFILLMINNMSKKMEKFQQPLYYLMIQSFGSMMILSSLTFNSFFTMNMNNILMLLAISLKMGIFPLHFWMYKMKIYLSKLEFMLLISIQKLPMMNLILLIMNKQMMLLMFINMLMGSYFIIKENKNFDIKNMIISSSIYSTLWLMLSMMLSFFMFLLFMFNYLMMMSSMYTDIESKKSLKFLNLEEKLSLLISVLFILGLPPMSFFFFKYFILNFMFKSFSLFLILILWMSTFIATVGYFKMFYKLFFMSMAMYSKKNKNEMKMLMLKFLIPMNMMIYLIL